MTSVCRAAVLCSLVAVTSCSSEARPGRCLEDQKCDALAADGSIHPSEDASAASDASLPPAADAATCLTQWFYRYTGTDFDIDNDQLIARIGTSPDNLTRTSVLQHSPSWPALHVLEGDFDITVDVAANPTLEMNKQEVGFGAQIEASGTPWTLTYALLWLRRTGNATSLSGEIAALPGAEQTTSLLQAEIPTTLRFARFTHPTTGLRTLSTTISQGGQVRASREVVLAPGHVLDGPLELLLYGTSVASGYSGEFRVDRVVQNGPGSGPSDEFSCNSVVQQ